MKTDTRITATRKALKNALLTCLAQKPIEKITVSEICHVSKLNRSTFYKHYKNGQDLLASVQEEFKNSYEDAFSKCDITHSPDFTDAIFSLMKNEEDLWACVVLSGRHMPFINELIKITKKYCMPVWKKYLVKCTDIEIEMLLTLFIRGLLYIVVENYKKIPHEEMRKFMKRTMRNCLSPYIIESEIHILDDND